MPHMREQAEAILPEAHADIIGLACQALADPDWFRNVTSGCGAQVRLCRYTHYSEALDQHNRQVTCELGDREALSDLGIKRSSDGKRRSTPPHWQP